ncbi:MAG: YecH family protein [Candidatus Sumerlaeaceae bacterium]|nr:YecH family protein [Candidatus Sumerlaeaceae bacterium]
MDRHIHGHEVLNWMLSTGRGFSEGEWIEAIEQRFGAHTRFFTCSASGLDAAGLVAFLRARGKFRPVSEDGCLAADKSKMCAG